MPTPSVITMFFSEILITRCDIYTFSRGVICNFPGDVNRRIRFGKVWEGKGS